ncbi:MAG: 50S ribosomal protein L10 [Erysipelotrichia bacterium]|nr:50S ribosomal protein L10 [Erysipelotrichia bacterium]
MNQAVLANKIETVKKISEKAKKSQAILVCEYHGLSVAKLEEIRRVLRKENAEICVYKNSLVKRAFEKLDYAGAETILYGPNAFVFSEDVITAPKIIAKYARRYKKSLVIKGGVVEGVFADADTMKEVARLPGRDGLISMFLSCLQAPIRNFAYAVKAVAEQD